MTCTMRLRAAIDPDASTQNSTRLASRPSRTAVRRSSARNATRSPPRGRPGCFPAAARSVGVGNIQALDNNVLAATRYMARIRREFFASRQIGESERMAFVLAAYNMGPQRVQSLRAEARRRGLNPNQWFFQVERVAMEQLGMGVVSYVNAVNKYYLAYDRERFLLEPQKRKLSAKK